MSSEGAGPIGQRKTERRTWKSARGESVRETSVEIVPTEEPSNYARTWSACVDFIVTNFVTSFAVSFADLQVGPDKRTVSTRRVYYGRSLEPCVGVQRTQPDERVRSLIGG
jgi:hypothetical protein